MNKLTKKCVAAIASLAMAGTLCVAGAVTMASVAWGVPHPGVPQPHADNSPWGTKQDKTGTLTINKFKYADTVDGEGHHKGAALTGATFTLKKVTKIDNVDLKYDEFSTWSKIAGIVGALNRGDEASANLTFDDNTSPTSTVSENVTTFSKLPEGLYKVVETPPAGYGAADMTEFYITMPLIETKVENGATTTTYNWNPTINPKNKDISKTFTKKLDDGKDHNSVLAKDKTLYYTISASVNRTKSGTLSADDLNGFAVFDDFPTAAFASPTDASSAVESVKIGDGDDAGLTATDDYTVSIVKTSSEEGGKNLESTRNRILVKFTDAGLKKIANKLNAVTNGQDPKVNVAIKLDLSDTYQNGNAPTDTTSTEQNGKNEVVNKSGYFQASPKGTPNPDPIVSGDDDGGTSKVKYGWFDVFKYDAADEGKQTKTGLKGAEFRLFNTEEKANACAKKLVDASKTADDVTECSAASSTFKGEEATTQETTGKLKAAVKVQAGTNIYLVEVKAPEGYIRLPEVKAVNVEEGKLKIVDFFNTKKNTFGTWFNLPATGATGVIIFALAGMGLIAASVFLYMRNRKEEEQAKA
ncbi:MULTISPECIES: SpaH/EbpB family LPXTG-anchored major pilin [Gardnerella]|uniref:SpaH/EbpB family LPXTG-anchored major pilin n=1 Tax=Gardnerella TaxID=2701 RepID=UPI0015730C81|nr:SpaH/EbpB family LPXTG-anchored major pilin [Gardnerella vaginalis]MDK7784884.1 SpaH/EbpB family LPXTG-anchored major pilin [Bifidobacterium sp. UMB6791B]MDK8248734.1 SpaH/EbpB family LPXTG-anchored major pilin [Bifidobacterium sp. UMB6794B]MDK8635319.1 SpaH/EbpB family LPXTG-anchored major pilin [Bifidobacterium sp. UMB6791A]NSX25923.1 LPXTG cell wall anchor domain-containing protein [Gardnerella vaginalis]